MNCCIWDKSVADYPRFENEYSDDALAGWEKTKEPGNQSSSCFTVKLAVTGKNQHFIENKIFAFCR